ncbi:MAG: T9SS type A sorting domain-containing protein [Bacteroidota bacterium]
MNHLYLPIGLLFFTLNLMAQTPSYPCSQTCPNEVLSFENVPSAEGFFCARNDIKLAGWIRSEQTATFLSGSRVILQAGFRASAGSRVIAFTDNCGGLPTPNQQQHYLIPQSKPVFSYRVAPNPIYDEGQVQLELGEDRQVAIDLVNVHGQVQQTVIKEMLLEAGRHQFILNTQSITTGIYFLKITIAEQQYTRRIVVTK